MRHKVRPKPRFTDTLRSVENNHLVVPATRFYGAIYHAKQDVSRGKCGYGVICNGETAVLKEGIDSIAGIPLGQVLQPFQQGIDAIASRSGVYGGHKLPSRERYRCGVLFLAKTGDKCTLIVQFRHIEAVALDVRA